MSPLLESTTFLVKTFMRPRCLDRLVGSIHRFYPGAQILVADDSEDPVQRTDARVYPLPFDSGISYGRNYLVDRVDTKYLVLMDDDHVFTAETKIEKLVEALEGGPFDLVGAHVYEKRGHFPWEGIFERDGATLTITPASGREIDGVLQVHLCHNFFAARTEALRRVRWDDHFKMGEHTDFFFRAHQQMRIGVCPAVHVSHAPERPPGYGEFRERAKSFRADFLKKHGLNEMVNEVWTAWISGRDRLDRPG